MRIPTYKRNHWGGRDPMTIGDYVAWALKRMLGICS